MFLMGFPLCSTNAPSVFAAYLDEINHLNSLSVSRIRLNNTRNGIGSMTSRGTVQLLASLQGCGTRGSAMLRPPPPYPCRQNEDIESHKKRNHQERHRLSPSSSATEEYVTL
jgi:hypothetical protein